ncbi:MAG: MAPEG family protein, partial [Gemmatimonadota bacterium]
MSARKVTPPHSFSTGPGAHPVAVVAVLALIEYLVFGSLVGRERRRRDIEAPAISGDPIFERYMRVHQNTLEQLV